MSSIVAPGSAALASRRRPARRLATIVCDPPVLAFLASRVLVWAAGTTGAVALPRVGGWSKFDPGRVSSSFGSLGNAFAAPAVRWDAIWYLGIAHHGYTSGASTTFFPLYPLLIRGLGAVVGSYVLAGVVISMIAFGVALVLLHRLTELELGRRAADATVLLVAFAPLSFIFSALYTESLFLALSVGAVYAARRNRWAFAATLGCLATLTRVPGVLLVIPLTLLAVRDWRARGGRPPFRRLAWLALVPAGLATYAAFLMLHGFSALNPVHQQTGVAHDHRFTGPIVAVVDAIGAAARGIRALADGAQPIYQHWLGAPLAPGAESIYLLLVLVVAAGAICGAFRRLPVAYGAYATVALLVCVWSPVTGQPLKSLDRYVLTIFPLFMVGGAWLSERRLTRPAVCLGAVLLVLSTVDFTTWTFIA